MNIPTNIIKGKDLDSFFIDRITENEKAFQAYLSKYDAHDLFHKWRELIRHIDELYNITELLDEEEEEMLLSCSLDFYSVGNFSRVVDVVGRKYGVEVQRRFSQSCKMLCHINLAYKLQGFRELCCDTIGDAIRKLQSRRLVFISMLMLIPKYAKGKEKLLFELLLIDFQPQIDLVLINVRTAYNNLLINKCINDFAATPTEIGLLFNFTFNHLEDDFLEPIRMNECEVMEQMDSIERSMLPHRKAHQIFGYDEMMEGITMTSAVYDKYGVNELPQFKEMQQLANILKTYIQDDYAFIVPEVDFNQLCAQYPHLVLWHDCEDYYDILNSRPAFFKFEKAYYSTVLLYQGYMINEIQRLLDKKKKFQVDSGFVFEAKVKPMLNCFGYDIKDIKRIKRKEFDVVTVKDGCIYNFQCKNNFINVSQQGEGAFKKTYQSIRRLNKYYENALKKEDGRDYLLKEQLGIDQVKSFVISRFPVITRNERIINFNQLPARLAMGL